MLEAQRARPLLKPSIQIISMFVFSNGSAHFSFVLPLPVLPPERVL